MKTADNQRYYDSFSKTYDNKRFAGYHALVDDLEVAAVEPFCRDRSVLEAGCGTGLILKRLSGIASQITGIDLSKGMLDQARRRELPVLQSDILSLPFPDETFDTVVSFKVLAHVEPISDAIEELVRVTRPGGVLALEFYNPVSFRGLIKRLKPPSRTSEAFHDEDIITRYDTPASIRSYLPGNAELFGLRGVRVFTPTAAVHKIPGIRNVFRWLEFASLDSPLARYAGFVIALVRKTG